MYLDTNYYKNKLTHNVTEINTEIHYFPHLSPPLLTHNSPILYRSTHANIPIAAQQNVSWKALTPHWNGPVVSGLGS